MPSSLVPESKRSHPPPIPKIVVVLFLAWKAEGANFPSSKGDTLAEFFWTVLTQIWWFVRRSCIRQQSIELLPFQTVVKGLLFAKGGEGPFCPGLGFWCFKHFSVWNRVHARYVQIAAVIRSLASIGWDERRHPAPIWVAQCFTFLCAIGEEIHACKHERKKKETTDISFGIMSSCWQIRKITPKEREVEREMP